jgi:hypothetical protein
MAQKETFLKKNIYQINIVLAFVFVFSLGFMIGGQRAMVHAKRYAMHNSMAKSKGKCDCAMKKKSMQSKKECPFKKKQQAKHQPKSNTNVVVKELSGEEAKAEFNRVQNEMNQMHNKIMQQHRQFFNQR